MKRFMKSRIVQAWAPRGRIARVIVAVAFAGLFTACRDTSGPVTLSAVTISPISATLAVNGTQQFSAVGTVSGANVTIKGETWAVVAGGGSINATTGLFTAGTTAGTFTNTVKVTCAGVSSFATVIVTAGALFTITVTPNPVTLVISTQQQFTAVGKDANGNVVPIPAPLVWSVVNPVAGTIVSTSGLFTAGTTPGAYANTVKATSGTVSGTATVNVTVGSLFTITVTPNPGTLPINTTLQYTAVGKDVGGNVVPIPAPLVWSVVNPVAGTIVSTSGLFTAGTTPGAYANTVKATSGTVSGTATVVVTVGPLFTITVTPNPDTLAISTQQQFTAVGKDAGGNVVPIPAPLVWSVVDPVAGTINSTSGLFTAGTTPGTYDNTVKATSGTVSGTATVVVIAGSLFSITVTPNPDTLAISTQQQFTAVGKDVNGNVVPIPVPLVWSVVDPVAGTIVSTSGLFTAGTTPGTYPNTVKATSGTIFGTATVIVTSPPPPPSPLGSAANFAILAGAGIRCAISGTVSGATGPADIGSSPTLTISGFPPCTFTGSIPLPAVVATAKGDLTTAYLAAQGQVCNLNISGIDLGFYDGSTPTKTLPPGTYCFSTSAALTGSMVLTGSAAAKWTFQIGSTLDANVGSNVILAGGAIPDNVTWAVGSSATLLTNAQFQGNILALQDITLQNGVILKGRALAQVGAVDLIAGTAVIIKP